MGHIRKIKKGRWQARYIDPTGRERAKDFSREAEAKNFLSVIQGQLQTGDWIDPRLGRTAFEDYAGQWLNTKHGVNARTLINIEGRVRNHLLPEFGARPLVSIRPADVRAWVKTLSASGLSPSTVKACYLTFNQIMRTAVIDRLISLSPCIGIELPPQRSAEEMHFLDPEEVRRLAEAIAPRFRPLIYVAAYMGLRAGELHALKLNRVNLLHGTLDVVASLSEVRGQIHIGPTKTGKARTLLIPRFLVKMLRAHLDAFPSEDGFVFTSDKGGPIRHRNFYRRHYKPAVALSGLPLDLRFHDLRHTCAALLIADRRHMEEVKEYLGHSSIRVTSDRYGHLFPKMRETLRDGLDRLFSEVISEPEPNLRRTFDGLLAPKVMAESKEEQQYIASDQDTYLERTTGFEPATLTLAR